MALFRALGVISLPGGRVKPNQKIELDADTAAGLLAAGMIEPASDEAGGGETSAPLLITLTGEMEKLAERAATAETACEMLKVERAALEERLHDAETRLAQVLAQSEADLAALREPSDPPPSDASTSTKAKAVKAKG